MAAGMGGKLLVECSCTSHTSNFNSRKLAEEPAGAVGGLNEQVQHLIDQVRYRYDSLLPPPYC